MPHPPISIRLTDRVYEILSAEARAYGWSVGQVIRELVEQGAAEIRRAQIRAEGATVAARYRSDPQVRAFYDGIAAAGSEAIERALPEQAPEK